MLIFLNADISRIRINTVGIENIPPLLQVSAWRPVMLLTLTFLLLLQLLLLSSKVGFQQQEKFKNKRSQLIAKEVVTYGSVAEYC
jgi:hypothetical protein